MKRILSGIFAALLILCVLPVAAFAEQQPSDSEVFHSPPKTILVEMSKTPVCSQMHAKYSALVLQGSCFTHLCYP